MLKQYESTAEMAEQAVTRDPNNTRLLLAACYAQTDRMDDARRHAQEHLRINPTISLRDYASTHPYKNKADLDHELDALRKAGLAKRLPFVESN